MSLSIYKLFYILYKINLLSPLSLYRLATAIYTGGINLLTLLHFSAKTSGERIAVIDEHETLTYSQLFSQSEALSINLHEKYELGSGKKVGIICTNHASLIKTIYAVSATGADIYLLNAKMSNSQLQQAVQQHHFDLLVIDEEQSDLFDSFKYAKPIVLSYHQTLPAINNLTAAISNTTKKRRSSSGKLVLFTGGTTGKAKQAAHKPSLFNYLDPFYGFLTKLNILDYKTAYIATPIFHGYGVAVLLLFNALGKKVIVRRKFNAKIACDLIRDNKVEVITVVPLMLHKMIRNDEEALKSLTCIASGGAELNPKLANEVLSKLGKVLYNLYGTSEAGLNMIATPQDLSYSPQTIGKSIQGVNLKLLDEQMNEVKVGEVGQLCISNKWSIKNRAARWIETGDLGYQDENGYYYLRGRVDSMIVSAGENVYPLEVEQVLLTHQQVEDASVIGIDDEHYGKRLKAFVQLTPNTKIKTDDIVEWLRARLASYQLPKEIVFVDELPYTSVGKLNRKQLYTNLHNSSHHLNNR